MKIHRLVRHPGETGEIRVKLLTVCFFFAAGAILGFILHGAVTPDDNQGLREYILQYAGLTAGKKLAPASLLSVAGIYFRYPLLVVLLGQAAAGVVLIPLLCLLQGCSLAFSVACFASALGRGGVLLALASFGLRWLLLLPCFFLLAAEYIGGTRHTTDARKKKIGKRQEFDQRRHLRLFMCLLWLLIGVIAESIFVPDIFQLVLSRITF